MSFPVKRCSDSMRSHLRRLLGQFGLEVTEVASQAPIPGSYWGAPEAGLVGNTLSIRPDTPVHSALHEAGHFICMDEERRQALDTDAGGEISEENAVCYLQALLADQLPGYDRQQLFADMDAWGYSFRLGSAAAWFHRDAQDARDWLLEHSLIDHSERPTGHCR
jgi:hypothetical protein